MVIEDDEDDEDDDVSAGLTEEVGDEATSVVTEEVGAGGEITNSSATSLVVAAACDSFDFNESSGRRGMVGVRLTGDGGTTEITVAGVGVGVGATAGDNFGEAFGSTAGTVLVGALMTSEAAGVEDDDDDDDTGVVVDSDLGVSTA